MSIIINAILIKIEKKIIPNGTLIKVNGYNLHVYSEGKINNKPSLVFMAGNGTPAPVYDFKPLYSLLKDEYHIIVVEKIGYGYADIVDADRDIDIILEETRHAIKFLGNNGPFVLLPHSMSGLEAFYWQNKYPEEITAIIGLDMAFPECYDILNEVNEADDKTYSGMKLFYYAAKTGFLRIPFFVSNVINVNNASLTADEYKQAKYLLYRNCMNITVLNEGRKVHSNAKKVGASNNFNRNIKMLLFSSNGEGLNPSWVTLQKEFATKMDSEIIFFDCGHFVHIYETQKIADKCKRFLNDILN
jgi:pimeloyl-ACP methyl ester carboxylesterase